MLRYLILGRTIQTAPDMFSTLLGSLFQKKTISFSFHVRIRTINSGFNGEVYIMQHVWGVFKGRKRILKIEILINPSISNRAFFNTLANKLRTGWQRENRFHKVSVLLRPCSIYMQIYDFFLIKRNRDECSKRHKKTDRLSLDFLVNFKQPTQQV